MTLENVVPKDALVVTISDTFEDQCMTKSVSL
jgi:hypothetical protein